MQGDSASVEEELDFEPEDSFGRLLVHGIAQFHGLESASGTSRGVVTVRRKLQGGQLPPTLTLPGRMHQVSCTDLLIAVSELGDLGMTHEGLQTFLRSRGVKGTWSEEDGPGLEQ